MQSVYYLEVIVDNLSIELDSDLHYHHHYHIGDVIKIMMSSEFGPKVQFGAVEYDAIFTHNWDNVGTKRYTIASLLKMRFVSDITKMVRRQAKLKELGI